MCLRTDALDTIDIHRGRGQVRLRDAIRISLGRAFSTRETLYHSVLWGSWTALLNVLISRPDSRLAAASGSLLLAFAIGFFSPITWRWRLLPVGSPFTRVLLVNGLISAVVGYAVFFCCLSLGILLFNGPDAFNPYLVRSLATVSIAGLVFTIIGYYIVTSQDQDRLAARHERKRRQLERLAEEAHLVALRAQINPHFFFNALNTIAALIPRRPESAERAVELLATALRPVLTREQPMLATLADELRITRAYAEIEKLRLGDRAEIVFAVDPGLDGVELPSLVLQPLLENAIIHGAARTEGNCRITVEARRGDGVLLLRIVNAPAPGDDVPAGPMDSVPFESGHALHNIALRVAALFGPSASLSVRRNADGDSAVTELRVPMGGPLEAARGILQQAAVARVAPNLAGHTFPRRREAAHDG